MSLHLLANTFFSVISRPSMPMAANFPVVVHLWVQIREDQVHLPVGYLKIGL